MKKYLIISLSVFFFMKGATAQINTNYLFSDEAPSMWNTNPASLGNEKVFVGLPVLSGIDANAVHNGFTYDDAITNDQVNIASTIEQLRDENDIMFNSSFQLLNFGFRLGQWHFRGGAQQVISTRITYPKSFMELAWKGNGHPDLIGRRLDFGGFAVNAMAYTDYFAGFSRQLMEERLTIGANIHYLQGADVVYTEQSSFGLTTDADTYALTADGGFILRTTVDENALDSISADYFTPFNGANSGFSFDLGAKYRFLEKFELQASAMNVGGIRWDRNAQSYTLSNTSFTYNGVDLESLVDNPDSTTSQLEDVLDSLATSFEPIEGRGAFTSPSNARFYLGFGYEINKNNHLMLTAAHLRSFNKGFNSVAAMYRHRFGRILWVRTGAQLFQLDQFLWPVGLTINAGPVQFGFGTDNLIAAFAPTKAGVFTGHFQIGLRFGRDGKIEKE
ncbi:MAG: DUF5723 family protein [Bacteroidetes bacterium]|nr:DUF5723 family protein [Bacteroidota bacterium]